MKIVLYVDKPKWAIDNHCDEIMRCLSDKFGFQKFYRQERFNPADFDLVYCQVWKIPSWCPREKLVGHVAGVHSQTLEYIIKQTNKVARAGVMARYMVDNLNGRTEVPIRYLPLGINTDVFIPQCKYDSEILTVGWNGQAVKASGYSDKRIDVIERVVSGLDNVQLQTNMFSKERGEYYDLVEFYHHIDAYVCFSEEEGFGLPIMEAASCGVPVVSTNVGCVPEIDGIMTVETEAELKESLIELRDNINLRKDCGVKSRRSIEKRLSWDVLKHEYEDFFNGV